MSRSVGSVTGARILEAGAWEGEGPDAVAPGPGVGLVSRLGFAAVQRLAELQGPVGLALPVGGALGVHRQAQLPLAIGAGQPLGRQRGPGVRKSVGEGG